MVNPAYKKERTITIKVVDRLKESMVSEGLITQDQLQAAEKEVKQKDKILGRVLVDSGYVTEEKLLNFIGDKVHIPYVDISKYTIDLNVLKIIPERIARFYNILPLFEIEKVLTVAMSDPVDIISCDEISKVIKYEIDPVLAPDESIKEAINRWYCIGVEKKDLIDKLAEELKSIVEEKEPEELYGKQLDEIRLRKEAEEAPIIKLVNSIIVQAVLENASDIHIEPKKDRLEVRYRIDGFLYNRHKLPFRLIPTIISRIKILSGMDISKRRIPQDGRMSFIVRNKNIYVRTSSFPCMYGENVVLRILDRSEGIPKLSEIGFSNENYNKLKKILKSSYGLILATGPTGCGKTTTNLSIINALNRPSLNLMTIEDPIEYEIEGIIQSQVNPKIDFTFANALRSILRQDPDIIYVGEIRDYETAEVAMRSALTGHLVISTLHTNNAVGTIVRLRDMGVENGLIAFLLNCSFAQRLIRRICPKCKKEYQPDEILLKGLEFPPDMKFYKGKGCDYCSGIGSKGRIGIFEILVTDKNIKELIVNNASEEEITQAARAKGMKSLFEDGLQKVVDGISTLEEVKRVTM